MKKIILSLFLFLAFGFVMACDENGGKKDEKPVINITETSLTLSVGETYTFEIDIEILMQSSSKNVVSVNETEKSITALKEGEAVITIYALQDTTVTKTVNVTVSEETSSDTINQIVKYVKEEVGTEGEDRIKLPTTHPQLGGTITWVCDSDIINVQKGTCQVDDNDQTANLTYTINLNGETKTGVIEYTIIGFNMIDAASAFINQIKGSKISGDLKLETEFDDCGGTTVVWASSNINILTNTGKFTKPDDPCNITITYTVTTTSPATTHTYSKTYGVEGKTLLEKIEPVIEWIDKNIAPYGTITETTDLPTTLVEYGATLSYKGSDGEEFDARKYTANPIISGRFILYITIKTNAGSYTYEKICAMEASSENSVWDNVELFLDQIASNNFNTAKKPTTGNGYLYKYGYIPFFEEGEVDIEEKLIQTNTAPRPGTTRAKSGIKYIVVHDTGSTSAGANADSIYRYLQTLVTAGTYTSWHYTIDEEKCIRSIPDLEISYHAGDGAYPSDYKFTNTKIQAVGKQPAKVTISSDGFYVLNGSKSTVRVPRKPDGTIPTNDDIPHNGIANYVNENTGTYWIGNTWWSKDYKSLGNFGGSSHGIGIESCTNSDGDYGVTERRLAKLVASLVIEYGLTIYDIKQHNDFSGKNCPAVLRSLGYWDRFIYLVQLEIYGQTILGDVEFEWTPTSNITEKGLIDTNIKSVSYSVTATYKGQSKTYNFTVTI